MFYCENCGAELPVGVAFCEQCGEPISVYAITGSLRFGTLASNIFSYYAWKDLWVEEVNVAENEGVEIGIILTNTKNCSTIKQLEAAVSKFIAHKHRQGVRYYCLDLATEMVCGGKGNPDVENVLSVLRKVYMQRVPDYLMILGDTDSVGAVTWKNCTGDRDAYVDSDLPYLTMDLESPWSGRKFDFKNAVPTGRIPGRAGDGFADACCYLENCVKLGPPNLGVDAFGLSAHCWRDVSEDIYRQLGKELLLSPAITAEDFTRRGIAGLNNGVEPNLLYFNLHGSNLENYWYGQRDNQMPRVFAAMYLPKRNGYVIGVEACYGAIQIDQKQPPSVLLEALRNGCIAYVGSNTIAFGGARRGQKCCADVIVCRFLQEVKCGRTAGMAFLSAMEELCSARHSDDAVIKTSVQFALYGDPSAQLVKREGSNYRRSGQRRTISVAIPDVQSAVRMSLMKVSADIESKICDYVDKYYREFAGTYPVSYKMQEGKLFQAMYSKENNGIIRTLKLYHDASGTVVKEYVSR